MAFDGRYGDDTRRIYEQASFGGRLQLGSRPAVLVVDFSRAFTEPDGPFGMDATAALSACRELLEVARSRRLLIVYTTVAYEPGLEDAGLTIQKSPAAAELQYGSRWVEIDPRLAPRDDEPVIVKKRPSAFFETNLVELFAEHGIDTAILCGASTSGCIRATAIDLFQHGYPTLVPHTCVADRAPGPHDANLFDIDAKYVDVVSQREALQYLEGVVAPTASPA
jgi:maleamate amidohydrolase